jgi:hypothetical protein
MTRNVALPPKQVQIAASLFAAAFILYGVILPSGRLLLYALAPENRGDAWPMQSFYALAADVIVVALRLALFTLAYLVILERRNWGRYLFLVLIGVEVLFARGLGNILYSQRLGSALSQLPHWLLLQGGDFLLYSIAAVLLSSRPANAWFLVVPAAK